MQSENDDGKHQHRKTEIDPSQKGKVCGRRFETIEDLLDYVAADESQQSQRPITQIPPRLLLRPHNKFGDIRVTQRTTYYRSNLHGAMKMLMKETYSKEHIELLKKTPFYWLFKGLYKRSKGVIARACKIEENLRKIFLQWDAPMQRLLGGVGLDITSRDVVLILGVLGGSERIRPNAEKVYTDPP